MYGKLVSFPPLPYIPFISQVNKPIYLFLQKPIVPRMVDPRGRRGAIADLFTRDLSVAVCAWLRTEHRSDCRHSPDGHVSASLAHFTTYEGGTFTVPLHFEQTPPYCALSVFRATCSP